jgi:hypothetical protein
MCDKFGNFISENLRIFLYKILRREPAFCTLIVESVNNLKPSASNFIFGTLRVVNLFTSSAKGFKIRK